LRASASMATSVSTNTVDTLGGLAVLVKNIGDIMNPGRTAAHTDPTCLTVPVARSPIRPSPSQLTRFLIHAETNLGVRDATLYESPLHRKRYGPDILPRVSDKALEEVGIQPGDVIRLKDGAAVWWNGPDAKRKRADDEETSEPTAKRNSVAYERRFDDGGGCHFSGPPMVGGDYSVPGETLWYKCTAQAQWLPVPPGYTVIIEEDDQWH
jgi:hypothetical protein